MNLALLNGGPIEVSSTGERGDEGFQIDAASGADRSILGRVWYPFRDA